MHLISRAVPGEQSPPIKQHGDLSPQELYLLAGRLVPWFAALAALLCGAGLFVGFLVAPTDAEQGESYRIIYIHVPAAWMSLLIYLLMAFRAAVGLLRNSAGSSMMASALAPTGAMFTFLALWTGALWGRPTWGAWWVWDARLTSELLLLFLYLGFVTLGAAVEDVRRADRLAGVLAIVGAVNVPIIYFSVQWWNTLHQGASVSLTAAPTIATSMLLGMGCMTLGFAAYTGAVSLLRVRNLILERERRSAWVVHAVNEPHGLG